MEQFLTHMDCKNGYKVSDPAGWQKQSLSPTLIGFFAPREGSNDIFSENVNVGVEESVVSLREYVDFQVNQMKFMGAGMNLTSRLNSIVAGLPAERIEFTGSLGPIMRQGRMERIPMQWLQVYILKNRRIYCFTYPAEPHAFDTYLPQVEGMLESMEVS